MSIQFPVSPSAQNHTCSPTLVVLDETTLSPSSRFNENSSLCPSPKTHYNLTDKQKLVHQLALEYFGGNDAKAVPFTTTITRIQNQLEKGESQFFSASHNFPHPFEIDKYCLYVYTKTFGNIKTLGKGATSRVYDVKGFPIHRSNVGGMTLTPSCPKPLARKVAQTKRKKFATIPDLGAGYRLNRPLFVSQRKNSGFSCATFERFETTLNCLDYEQLTNPTKTLFPILNDYVIGLAHIHDSEQIHGDLKGDNLLAEPRERKGSITDFETMRREPKSPIHSSGTLRYLDPSIYGSPSKNVRNQADNRKGIPDRPADLFSFGRTIEKDVVTRYLEAKADQFEIAGIHQLLKDNFPEKPQIDPEELTEAKLQELGEKNHHLVLYESPEHILVYSPILERQKNLLSAFKMLQGKISDSEWQFFQSLTHLAFQLQGDRENRPDVHTLMEKLSQMQPADTHGDDADNSAKRRKITKSPQ